MTRFLLYIALLSIPASGFAQENSGDITIVADSTVSVQVDTAATEYSEYDSDNSPSKQAAAEASPAVYAQRKFKDGFKSKYKDDEDFDYEPKPESQSALARFFAFIRKILEKIFGTPKASKSAGAGWLVKIIAFGIIMAAVYFIVRSILKKDGMWLFGRSGRAIKQSPEEEGQNIHEMDFNTLTNNAINENDYRLAVRFYYLWLLKRLSARGIIDWNWDKTNTDYYYEIKDNNLRDEFKYLSYVYDYCWYGEFKIDSEAFSKAEKAFKKTLNTL